MAQIKQIIVTKDQSDTLGKVVRSMIGLGEKYAELGRKIEYIKGPFLNPDNGDNLFVIGYEEKQSEIKKTRRKSTKNRQA